MTNGHERMLDTPESLVSDADSTKNHGDKTEPEPTATVPKKGGRPKKYKKSRNTDPDPDVKGSVVYLYGKPLPPPVDRGNLQRQRKVPKKYAMDETNPFPRTKRYRSISGSSKSVSPGKGKRGRPRKSQDSSPRRKRNISSQSSSNYPDLDFSSEYEDYACEKKPRLEEIESDEFHPEISPVKPKKRGRKPLKSSAASTTGHSVRLPRRKRKYKLKKDRIERVFKKSRGHLSNAKSDKPPRVYGPRGPYKKKKKPTETETTIENKFESKVETKPTRSSTLKHENIIETEIVLPPEEIPYVSPPDTKVVIPASLVIKKGRGRPRKSDYELTAKDGLVERIERPKRWSTSAVDGEESRRSSIADDKATDMVAALHAGLGDEEKGEDFENFAQLQPANELEDLEKFLEAPSPASTDAVPPREEVNSSSLDMLSQDTDLSSAFEGLERDLMVMKKGDKIIPSSSESKESKDSFKLTKSQQVENWERGRKSGEDDIQLTTVSKNLAIQCALRISEKYVPTPHCVFLQHILGDKTEENKENVGKKMFVGENNNAGECSLDERTIDSGTGESESQSSLAQETSGKKADQKSSGEEIPKRFVYKPESGEIRCKLIRVNDKYLLIDNVRYIEADCNSYIKEADVPVEYDEELESSLKVEEETKGENGVCTLASCRLGCICESLKYTYSADHCRKFNCMMDCICLDGRRLTWETEHAADIRSRLRPRFSLMSWKNRLSQDTDGVGFTVNCFS